MRCAEAREQEIVRLLFSRYDGGVSLTDARIAEKVGVSIWTVRAIRRSPEVATALARLKADATQRKASRPTFRPGETALVAKESLNLGGQLVTVLSHVGRTSLDASVRSASGGLWEIPAEYLQPLSGGGEAPSAEGSGAKERLASRLPSPPPLPPAGQHALGTLAPSP